MTGAGFNLRRGHRWDRLQNMHDLATFSVKHDVFDTFSHLHEPCEIPCRSPFTPAVSRPVAKILATVRASPLMTAPLSNWSGLHAENPRQSKNSLDIWMWATTVAFRQAERLVLESLSLISASEIVMVQRWTASNRIKSLAPHR